jgi:hypothetical protein
LPVEPCQQSGFGPGSPSGKFAGPLSAAAAKAKQTGDAHEICSGEDCADEKLAHLLLVRRASRHEVQKLRFD